MKRKLMLRLAALPLVAVLGALPVVAGCDVAGDLACPEFSAEQQFGANLDIDANVRTFMVSAGTRQVLGEEMLADVSAACIDVATAAGRDPATWEGKEGSDLVEIACDEADLGIQAAFSAAANASLEILVEGGECKVSLDATADCYAGCTVEGGCTPGEITVECEPGKLAGSCSGSCTGSCEGGTIECNGECTATCTGSCAGDCVGRCDGADSTGACAGECDGQCRGTCQGTCTGSCEYQAVECQGTCTGECSVELQEPYCTGDIVEPMCDLDAECKAQCEANVQAEAVCTPPVVTVNVVGEGTAELAAVANALATHLPTLILNGIDRGQAAIDAAVALQTSGEAIVNGTADLTAKAIACAGVAATAAANASINIQVSVQASASVSTSAGANVQ